MAEFAAGEVSALKGMVTEVDSEIGGLAVPDEPKH
jgi:hypothetical protein